MIKKTCQLVVIAVVFFNPLNVSGITHQIPKSLVPALLSESVPFAFTPDDFRVEDYKVEWLGKPIKGVSFHLGKESLEWVRVHTVLVLPRGRLIVHAKNVENGKLSNIGFNQSFDVDDKNNGVAQIPVALISGKKNHIEVTVNRNGKMQVGHLVVRFDPRSHKHSTVISDTTCSRFKVSAEVEKIDEDSWIYLGCRLVYVQGEEHMTASLELFIFWDNVGQTIKIDDVETASTTDSLWPMRLRSRPGKVRLSSGDQNVTIKYSVPDRMHYGFIGMGLGPYGYYYSSDTDVLASSYVPLLTLYGSFFINEAMRIVMFNATAFHSNFYTDTGVYFLIEQVRSIDERFSVNILLGSHVIGFKTQDFGTQFKLGGPQGVEMVFRDFLMKGKNVSLGAFLLPVVNGKSYINTWVRWGGSSLFWEINYISWREQINNQNFYSRSFGLSVGMPIGFFL